MENLVVRISFVLFFQRVVKIPSSFDLVVLEGTLVIDVAIRSGSSEVLEFDLVLVLVPLVFELGLELVPSFEILLIPERSLDCEFGFEAFAVVIAEGGSDDAVVDGEGDSFEGGEEGERKKVVGDLGSDTKVMEVEGEKGVSSSRRSRRLKSRREERGGRLTEALTSKLPMNSRSSSVGNLDAIPSITTGGSSYP